MKSRSPVYLFATCLLALTAWVQNSGPGRMGFRLFTQFTQNRFFESDGRLGLQVTYAL